MSVCEREGETFLSEVDAKEQAELKTDCPELLCFSGTNEALAGHLSLAAVNLLAIG